MKPLLILLLTLTAMAPLPAEASWAIAIAKGGNPVVVGNDELSVDQGAYAVQVCAQQYPHGTCKVIAKGNHSCVALANNGASGAALRWTAGQGSSQSAADALALNSCSAGHSGTCKVVHDFCR